jgi:hypothetical protein
MTNVHWFFFKILTNLLRTFSESFWDLNSNLIRMSIFLNDQKIRRYLNPKIKDSTQHYSQPLLLFFSLFFYLAILSTKWENKKLKCDSWVTIINNTWLDKKHNQKIASASNRSCYSYLVHLQKDIRLLSLFLFFPLLHLFFVNAGQKFSSRLLLRSRQKSDWNGIRRKRKNEIQTLRFAKEKRREGRDRREIEQRNKVERHPIQTHFAFGREPLCDGRIRSRWRPKRNVNMVRNKILRWPLKDLFSACCIISFPTGKRQSVKTFSPI